MFSSYYGIHFAIFWELYGFLLHPKYFRNPTLWNACFFPYYSHIMGIHFYHTLGIVWTSASSEIFKKPINFKCLCFPILFPYNWNPLFPCFGNCMDFCLKRKISEILNFEMLMFYHIFPLLWEFAFRFFAYFGNCIYYATHEICKKPMTLKCLCFLLWEFSYFPCSRNCMGFYFTRNRVVRNI